MARINSFEWRSLRRYLQAPARAKRQAPHLLSSLASLPASSAPSFIPSGCQQIALSAPMCCLSLTLILSKLSDVALSPQAGLRARLERSRKQS